MHDDDNLIEFPARPQPPAPDLAAGALRSGWLTLGDHARRLQETVASLLGEAPCLIVGSPTAALNLTLLALEGEGRDEIALPAVADPSLLTVTVLAGARPLFADIVAADEPVVDPRALAAVVGPRTRAAIVAHRAGLAPDIGGLRAALTGGRNGGRTVTVVEDARGTLVAWQRSLAGAGSPDYAVLTTDGRSGSGAVVRCPDTVSLRRLERLRSELAGHEDECLEHACDPDTAPSYRLDEATAAFAQRDLATLEERAATLHLLAEQAAAAFAEAGFETVGRRHGSAWVSGPTSLAVLSADGGQAGRLVDRAEAAGLPAVRPIPAYREPPFNAHLPRPSLPNTEAYCSRAVEFSVTPELVRFARTLAGSRHPGS